MAHLPGKANDAFDFIGRCAVAIPKAAVTPSSVDWRSLPRLMQEIGADALPVTSAANLLVGIIIGLLGISQARTLRCDLLCSPNSWWSRISESLDRS